MLQKTSQDVPTVTAGWVNTALENDEIILVDVRETKEYEVEHIAGALLLPLSSFDAELFPSLPGKQLVLHCAIGKRSEAAGRMLLKEGHAGLVHMEGGLKAWKEAGLPTEVQLAPHEDAVETQAPVYLCPAPGEILAGEFLAPLEIQPAELALALKVGEPTVRRLLDGELVVDVELSLRLARYFSTAADFWVHLQIEHDLERARHTLGERIRKEIRPRAS
jgi:addiction module HigA family antidote